MTPDESETPARRNGRRSFSSGRSLNLGTGPTLLAALIVVALIVTGVLAYQAHDAASSHQEVAQQAVSDLASAAAWQFAERGSMRTVDLISESLMMPLRQMPDGGSSPADPSPLHRLSSAMEDWSDCGCVRVDPPATLFLLQDDELQVEGDPLPTETREWLADTLSTVAAERGEESPDLDTTQRHPGGGLLFRDEARDARAYVYLFHPTSGEVDATYGWAADAEEVAQAVLEPILASRSLLPESLTGGLPADSLFRLEVATPEGTTLLASEGPGGNGEVVTGGDRFPGWAGDLHVRVMVPEERAEALVIGGLPGSRLPLIVLLLVLTGGLLIAAVLLLRQVHRLARLRSDFVAGVTHELRTPLAQIRMFSEMLTLGTLDSSDDRDRALQVIDEESRRLDHLIDNVLGFARMGTTARHPASRPVALDQLLPEVVDRFRPLTRERSARIQLSVEEGLQALADPDAVHRVVVNLLDNAVKYGPRGQEIRVGAFSQGQWARIEVDDRGPGVPSGQRRRIWRPYERLARTNGTGAAGSGIGLAVVKALVEETGGQVAVEDAPGGGARFVVLLPLAAQASDRSPAASPAPPPATRRPAAAVSSAVTWED